MFESVACNLCGADDFDVVYKSSIQFEDLKPDLMTVAFCIKEYCQIVKCKKCGLIYANPRDRAEDLGKAYKQLGANEYLLEEESRLTTFARDVDDIEKYISEGRLLDLGCSVGLFLKIAKERGWDVFGVEASEVTSKYARDEFGLNVKTGMLHEVGFENDFFDVVTLWDVIEHVTDPLEVLKEVHRIQKRDGYLILSTVNIGSLFAKLTGKRWMCLIRSHIYYFTKKTMTAMLEKAGYEVIKIKTYSRIFRLKYLVGLVKPHSRILYSIANFFIKLFYMGNLRVSINFFDCMTVIARKKAI